MLTAGDLVSREGGSYRFPLEYLEGRNTIEVQITLKKWAAEFYRIAAGARTTQEQNIKNSSVVETVQSVGGGTGLEIDFNSTSNGVPVFGYYLAKFNGTNWDFYMVGSPQKAVLLDGQEFAFKLGETISTSAVDIGNGLAVKIGNRIHPIRRG